jgi:hypothetical protein
VRFGTQKQQHCRGSTSGALGAAHLPGLDSLHYNDTGMGSEKGRVSQPLGEFIRSDLPAALPGTLPRSFMSLAWAMVDRLTRAQTLHSDRQLRVGLLVHNRLAHFAQATDISANWRGLPATARAYGNGLATLCTVRGKAGVAVVKI